MSKTVQWKRGNTVENSTYIGPQGEITINTDNYDLLVHDGETPGGHPVSNLIDTVAVTSITVGVGLTQTQSVGNVGIDATGVQGVTGTPNQVTVYDAGSKNLTLSLPQNIATNSTVTFANLTITGNLTVSGTTTSAGQSTITSKTMTLANTATDSSQIDAGGVILGANAFARSILYNLVNDRWDTGVAGLKTSNLTANTSALDILYVARTAHFGSNYLGYDFGNSAIQIDGNVNSYMQHVIKNHSTGTKASSDLVAVNNLGTDDNYYIDMGINSSTYADPAYSIGGPNTGYLYNVGGDLTLGTASANTKLIFHVGGTQSNNSIGTANTAGFFLTNITVSNLNSTNLTNTGAISSLGNITGNYILGNGSHLTGVGTVTNVQGTGTVSGITLSGNVTSSGNLTLSGSVLAVTNLTSGNNIVLSGSTGNVTISKINGLQSVITGNNSATATLSIEDQYFGTIRTATGSCVVTLPAGSTVPIGRQFIIKDEGGSAGAGSKRITVATSNTDTIDGSASVDIASNHGSMTVLWTGAGWSII